MQNIEQDLAEARARVVELEQAETERIEWVKRAEQAEEVNDELREQLAALTRRWTTTRPTVPGWYWWRIDVHDTDIEVCEVSADVKRVRFAEGEWDLDQVVGEFGGEWSDQPIALPEEGNK